MNLISPFVVQSCVDSNRLLGSGSILSDSSRVNLWHLSIEINFPSIEANIRKNQDMRPPELSRVLANTPAKPTDMPISSFQRSRTINIGNITNAEAREQRISYH